MAAGEFWPAGVRASPLDRAIPGPEHHHVFASTVRLVRTQMSAQGVET